MGVKRTLVRISKINAKSSLNTKVFKSLRRGVYFPVPGKFRKNYANAMVTFEKF